MSYYDDRPDELVQDTKNFLNSEYGKYVMSTLEEMAVGNLAKADNMEHPYPERYLAKHSAQKEVIGFIQSPIG